MFRALYPNAKSVAYDVVGVLVWAYAVTKLFIFDIDRWVLDLTAPSMAWVLNLRFIAFVAVLLVTALLIGRKRFFKLVGYVVGFPLIFLFWRLPKAIATSRSWTAGLVILNSVISMATDVTYRLVYFVVYALAVAIIVMSQNVIWLWAATIAITMCVLSSYIKSCVDAFRAPRVLSLYTGLFEKLRGFATGTAEDAPPSLHVRLPAIPEDEVSKYVSHIQPRIIVGQLSLAFADRLRAYNESEIHVVGGVFLIFRLILITLISFSILYFSISKIEPAAIATSGEMSVFDYIYLSFDNMFFNMNSSASLATFHSQSLSMLQRFLSATLVAILLATFFEIRKKKHAKEIDAAIDAATATAEDVTIYIKAEFSYDDLSEAVDDLRGMKSSLYSSLGWLLSSPKKTPPKAVADDGLSDGEGKTTD